VPRLLNGIEAGGIATLALPVSGSLWRGDPWWMPFNLLGSTFYGARALSAGPDRALAGYLRSPLKSHPGRGFPAARKEAAGEPDGLE